MEKKPTPDDQKLDDKNRTLLITNLIQENFEKLVLYINDSYLKDFDKNNLIFSSFINYRVFFKYLFIWPT